MRLVFSARDSWFLFTLRFMFVLTVPLLVIRGSYLCCGFVLCWRFLFSFVVPLCVCDFCSLSFACACGFTIFSLTVLPSRLFHFFNAFSHLSVSLEPCCLAIITTSNKGQFFFFDSMTKIIELIKNFIILHQSERIMGSLIWVFQATDKTSSL